MGPINLADERIQEQPPAEGIQADSQAVGAPHSFILASRYSVLGPALLTAAMLWLSFFPVAWGWLGWVALVPLLVLVRHPASAKRAALGAWLGGLVFCIAAFQWLRVADPRMYATWIALSVYCSLYFPLTVLLLRLLENGVARRSHSSPSPPTPLPQRGEGSNRLSQVVSPNSRRGQYTGSLPLVLTLPVVWTALEHCRAHLMTGFPWYYLGHTQHDYPAIIQIADFAGAYGVTFVVASVNAVVFEWIWWTLDSMQSPKRIRNLMIQTAWVVLLLVGTIAYGGVRLADSTFTPGPRIALVQSNLPQDLRNTAGLERTDKFIVNHIAGLTDRAWAERPDLIVWPETSYPGYWVEAAKGTSGNKRSANLAERAAASRELAGDIARLWPVPLLAGMNSEVQRADGSTCLYNSAILIRPPGTADYRYDKHHRVPFGEYVPLRDWLPIMDYFAPYDFDYSISIGERFTRFPLGPYYFGVLICYEDSDPVLGRRYLGSADGDPDIDFLVNISNDGWFKGTSEHEEHLAICRFRAIETRRSVVRAVNMGISAVIDGNGRVLQPRLIRAGSDGKVWELSSGDTAGLPISDWAEFKQTAGVLLAVVPLDRRTSYYARWGDWLPATCWVILGTALAAGWLKRRGTAGADPSRSPSASG